ncbi:MAG: ABC transporter permease [Candidatus Caldarchaeum sp.]|nr:ABC transporter permease [Candidatus Caldarchaeum sp.]MCS7134127.1 ABC transporter permease [Candidatus Caldarchaeum sp.]MDW8063562.1 ABC transporter permease [Candidatus Caldarchaeum sp.]MDW8434886.1 ABC transporter permease [Candidatus Caldarchaeum sp.]
MTPRDSFKFFWSFGKSKVGVTLLAIFIIISVYVVFTYSPEYSRLIWNNPAAWEEYPKSVPPAWTSYFASKTPLETVFLSTDRPRVETMGTDRIYSWSLRYNYLADDLPTFVLLRIEQLKYNRAPPIINVALVRPDGVKIDLYTFIPPSPRPGEQPPYVRFETSPFRVKLESETQAVRAVSGFLFERYGLSISPSEVAATGIQRYIFGQMRPDKNFTVMKGTYEFQITMRVFDERDSFSKITVVLGGTVHGLMGTDTIGRDLAVGLLLGFPTSLFVGVVTSIFVTAVGAVLGTIGGYLGGRIDEIIQRAADIVNNVPLLPLTIFLIFVIGPSLANIVLVLVLFGWPGLTIVVRSVVLQVRESQFVEAARVLGSSTYRIVFLHVFPQVAPFIVAQMIFFVPNFILLEAALSFLGLGDPSLPTWGQLLELGFRNNAVYLGYWWWILPPGISIVAVAVVFVLIALGMEPVVNPRLRKR